MQGNRNLCYHSGLPLGSRNVKVFCPAETVLASIAGLPSNSNLTPVTVTLWLVLKTMSYCFRNDAGARCTSRVVMSPATEICEPTVPVPGHWYSLTSLMMPENVCSCATLYDGTALVGGCGARVRGSAMISASARRKVPKFLMSPLLASTLRSSVAPGCDGNHIAV